MLNMALRVQDTQNNRGEAGTQEPRRLKKRDSDHPDNQQTATLNAYHKHA